MKCINKSLPAIQELLKVIPRESILAGILDKYDNELPTKETVLQDYKELKNSKIYYALNINADLVKWLRERFQRYDVNDYGIINTFGKTLADYEREIIKNKLVELNSNYGKVYRLYDTSGGKYGISGMKSNYKQLTGTEQPSNTQIDNSLHKFITKVGISVETINNMKERLGIDAVAVADILHKVILISEGRASIDTLPEEVAHFFVELLPDGHPLLVSMMNEIESNPIYAEVVAEYNEVYEGDTNKLKKEAIGKLIAKEIISSNSTDKNQRVVRWWNKVWEYIKGKFTSDLSAKVKFINETAPELYNPFAEAASKIIEGNTRGLKKTGTGLYFQQAEQKAISDSYDALKARVTKKFIVNKEGQRVEDYDIDGKSREELGLSRITTVIRQRYKGAPRKDNLNNDTTYAEQGSLTHNMIDNIMLNVYRVNNKQLPIEFPWADKKEKEIYNSLLPIFSKFAQEFYDQGAIIKIEQPIINTKLGYIGTMDLVVIHTNGTQEIYDFKTRGAKQVYFAKREEYDKQVTLYKKMVEEGDSTYGIIPSKVTKTRIVGMQIVRNLDKTMRRIILDTYNLVVAEEKTNIDEIDSKIEVLRFKLDRMKFTFNSLYQSDEKSKLGENIEEVQDTIDKIIEDKDLIHILDYANTEIYSINKRLENSSLSYEELELSYRDILLFENLDLVSANDEELGDTFKAISANAKQTKHLYLKVMQQKLLKDAITQGILGRKTEDTFMLLDVAHSKLNAWGRGASFTKDDFVKMANEEIITSKEHARIKFEVFTDILREKINKFLSIEKDYSKLMNEETGDLHAKFSTVFFTEKQKAKTDKNWQWFKDNYTVTESTKTRYAELLDKYKATQQSLKEAIIVKKYKNIAVKYQNTGLTRIEAIVKEWELNHPIEMYGDLKNEAKFYSNEFKTIATTPHLLEFYNYWIESMKTFRELTGREFKVNTLPTIKADLVDRFIKNGIADSVKGMFTFDWLQDINYESNYDPSSKERLFNVPLPFIGHNYKELVDKYIKKGLSEEEAAEKAKEEFINNKSHDLGAAMRIFAAAAFNNRAMQDIEHKLAVIKILTQNLSVDNVDKNLSKEEKEKVVRNLHLIEEQVTDLMEVYIYGKKDNSAPEDIKTKEIVDTLNKVTAISRLGLNMFSPIVNLLGGTANSYMLAAKKVGFSTSNLNTGYGRHLSRSEKTNAFYKLFPVMMGEFLKEDVSDFTINNKGKYVNSDSPFVFQRIGDKAIQFGTLNAMLDSHTVVNGKIVNKRKYLKEKYNYSNSMSGEERREVLKKVDEEEKTLKSVYDLAEVIKEGKIDFEKLGLSEDELIKFKRKVTKTNKYIIGNTDINDLSMIKRNMWGRMAMTFRSWIQALGDERLMDSYYDSELEETLEGRYRVLHRLFKERGLAATLKLQLGLLKGIDEGLTDEDIAALHANARELQFILIGIAAFILSGWKDKKDQTGIERYIARICNRMVSELTFFVNPYAVFQIIKTPVAASSIVDDLGHFFKETFDAGYYGVLGTSEEFEKEVHLARATGKTVPILGQGIKFWETVANTEK